MNVAVDAATYLLRAFVRGSGGDVHPKLVMEFHMFLFKRHLGLVKLIETGAPPLVGVPTLLGRSSAETFGEVGSPPVELSPLWAEWIVSSYCCRTKHSRVGLWGVAPLGGSTPLSSSSQLPTDASKGTRSLPVPTAGAPVPPAGQPSLPLGIHGIVAELELVPGQHLIVLHMQSKHSGGVRRKMKQLLGWVGP